MASEIHVGDVGTSFRPTIYDGSTVVDLTDALTLQMIFRKPDNTTITKTATYPTGGTGSDGVIEYVSVDGDLDIAGLWKLQCYLVLCDNTKWHTDLYDFKVYYNL